MTDGPGADLLSDATVIDRLRTGVDPILRAINEGLVARYILKPWVRAELVQVLRWAIEASALGRDSAEIHRRLLETERLATLGSISALLVHDLRQPLAAIIGNIELLDALGDLSPMLREALRHVELDARTRKSASARLEELPAILSDMRTASELLSTMIGNLRDLSRPRDASQPALAADPMQVVRHRASSPAYRSRCAARTRSTEHVSGRGER